MLFHGGRTGRLPVDRASGEVEFKFNPWHDPVDGRFTFAGSGHYHGPGGAKPSARPPKPVGRGKLPKPQTATGPRLEAPRTGQPTKVGKRPGGGAIRVRPKLAVTLRGRDRPNPAAEFVGGAGEGLYDVARETVAAAHSALTTNPLTTVRNIGRGIARTIDTVVAAEDTPAVIQISRAADAVANASAREIGRATGSVVGNAALAVAPGAVLGKVPALRGVREAATRPSYHPPRIGWVKEKLNPGKPWTAYNDAAPGSRPGQAPALMRTMPDGSKRPVKFDGVQGDYVIDRKWSIRDASRA